MNPRFLLRRLLLLAGLTAAVPMSFALDLTPITTTHELEGFQIPVVNFTDGNSKVVWHAPTGWHLSGGGDHLTLYPQDRAQSSMELALTSRKAARAPAQEAASEEFVRWSVGFLPKDAAEVRFNCEVTNPFTLRTVSSRELTFGYLSQSRRVQTSIAIVDLYEEQSLLVIVTAREEDFAAVRRDAVKSMFRWSWEH